MNVHTELSVVILFFVCLFFTGCGRVVKSAFSLFMYYVFMYLCIQDACGGSVCRSLWFPWGALCFFTSE